MPGIVEAALTTRMQQSRLPVFVANERLDRLLSPVRRRHSAPARYVPPNKRVRVGGPGAGYLRLQFDAAAARVPAVQSRRLSRSLLVANICLASVRYVEMRSPRLSEALFGLCEPIRSQSITLFLPARVSPDSKTAVQTTTMYV